MTSITNGAIALLFDEIILTDLQKTPTESAIPAKQEPIRQEVNKVDKTIMLFPENFEVTGNKEHYLFYKNILKAIRLSEDKSEKINENNFSESMLTPGTFCICWGTQFGNDEPPYECISTKSGGTFLYADPMQYISIDKNMKSKLWIQLKSVYNV